MTTLGAVFRPQLPPERLRSVARAADEAGLEELWIWEDCFREGGISSAAMALAWTTQLRLGIGLMPVPFRNVALSAMELATLARVFPGRVRPAVGHGVQDWMAQVGARPASPMTCLREHLSALQALLAGERVTTSGRYVHLDDVALDWPPAQPPALITGATGDRTLRLSGELAAGTILTGGTTPDGVRRARGIVDEGRALAGRSDHHEVVVYLVAAAGPDSAERLERECRRWEFPAGADVTVGGDAESVANGVRRWAEAGADTVVLQPTEDEPDLEGFVRFAGEQVRPLLG
ncbi:alkanesulfonate monooxygenase SsuD/methylene tetrahydromethanopterin reductase-like flavin-dependent oxidoreductase (luciferase family) [Motilibacter peucedani]|uniref:Alkanesulfonate monooxygenase SsuD/methylene tetrahydromethanopterin reductase-like flavin-dependent oxidoreductase (Luciferase family) n=1 Tax=Motilibacter peucedani TaxID=598650 RepID=A0A420XM75_9ACTN|nr:LLM class flavin-dependent oxidoreductase [Motilibacter peucedani]RKS72481.1 alkanesulfonate monooxygenase SsuD/methylene tetrahydromethanopterin reductase-like flavin-dependent oxidoreductase (luciferase family) [Motilibacter peucedani]